MKQFPSLTPHGLQEAALSSNFWNSEKGLYEKGLQRILRRKVGNGRRAPTIRESPLCQAQSPLNEPQGTEPSHPSRGKQMLREAKGLAQGHRATGQNLKCMLILIFTPRGSLAAREGQHVSHLLLLGFGEFNTRRLPHTALFIHMKTSSENTLNSSGFTVPPKDLREEPALDTTSWNITTMAPAGDVDNKN